MTTEVVLVDERPYLARGWMNGITAPIGTVLGPNAVGEYLTVVQVEENRVRLAHSRTEDLVGIPPGARSVCEYLYQLSARWRR